MSEQTHPTGHGGGRAEANPDLAFGMAVAKGALVGIPVMLVFLSAAMWLITGRSAVDSIVIALLPGVLLGVFGGGFLGVLKGMEH